MVLKTSAPAIGSVCRRYLAGGNEAVVAFVADIIVAVVAGIAVESRVGGRNGVVAYVAILADGQRGVAVLPEVRHWNDDIGRLLGFSVEGAGMCHWQQRMRAVMALIDTGRTITPSTLKANVAVPIGSIRKRQATIAECTLLKISGKSRILDLLAGA